jgi:hypothetical protein
MSKKTTTETGPSKFAQPYITAGANAVQSAYQGNQQNIQNISKLMQDNTGNVLGQTLNNPGLQQAGAYNSDVLGGKYLNGNPYLQGIIDNTNSDVSNKVNAAIGTRGGAGGSAQAAIMARELAKNESNLRYTNYNNERSNQQAAVGGAASLSGAGDSNIAALLSYLTGQAQIPQSGANSYAAAIGGLLGNSTTSTSTQGAGSTIAGLLGAGLGGWASGGFKGV